MRRSRSTPVLEHGGDFTAAAAALRTEGFGGDGDGSHVDLSHIPRRRPRPSRHRRPRPSILILALCRRSSTAYRGFISEVMDHCLATAPYPQRPVGVLRGPGAAGHAGRPEGPRPGRQPAATFTSWPWRSPRSGKDWPRKLNTFVLHRVGLVDSAGREVRLRRGHPGHSLFRTAPSMLFQTDEIDGLLQLINKAQDARHENILGTLLTMYSAANSIFPHAPQGGQGVAGRHRPAVPGGPTAQRSPRTTTARCRSGCSLTASSPAC